jgi:hypothetical protein
MPHTSETHETYDCNMCSSTCYTTIEAHAELDAGAELEVAHGQQADGLWNGGRHKAQTRVRNARHEARGRRVHPVLWSEARDTG